MSGEYLKYVTALCIGCRHVVNLQINSSVVTIVGSQCESNYKDGKYCVNVCIDMEGIT